MAPYLTVGSLCKTLVVPRLIWVVLLGGVVVIGQSTLMVDNLVNVVIIGNVAIQDSSGGMVVYNWCYSKVDSTPSIPNYQVFINRVYQLLGL